MVHRRARAWRASWAPGQRIKGGGAIGLIRAESTKFPAKEDLRPRKGLGKDRGLSSLRSRYGMLTLFRVQQRGFWVAKNNRHLLLDHRQGPDYKTSVIGSASPADGCGGEMAEWPKAQVC
jgi:hypothetical protein